MVIFRFSLKIMPTLLVDFNFILYLCTQNIETRHRDESCQLHSYAETHGRTIINIHFTQQPAQQSTQQIPPPFK